MEWAKEHLEILIGMILILLRISPLWQKLIRFLPLLKELIDVLKQLSEYIEDRRTKEKIKEVVFIAEKLINQEMKEEEIREITYSLLLKENIDIEKNKEFINALINILIKYKAGKLSEEMIRGIFSSKSSSILPKILQIPVRVVRIILGI